MKRLFWMLPILILIIGLAVFSAVSAQSTRTARVPTARLAWSPDGTMIAAAYDNAVHILKADTLESLNVLPEVKDEYPNFAWSPDGTRIALINDFSVEVWSKPWELTAQELISYCYCFAHLDFESQKTRDSLDAFAWSPDGNYIVSAAKDITLIPYPDYTLVETKKFLDIWRANTGELLKQIKHDRVAIDYPVLKLAWNTNGKIAGSNLWEVYVWDEATGEETERFELSAVVDVDKFRIESLSWNMDGSALALAMTDGTTRIRDLSQPIRFEPSWSKTYYGDIVMRGHVRDVLSARWHPSGSMLATGSVDGSVIIWDVGRAEPIKRIDLGTTVQILSIDWSPDGTKLAYGRDGQGSIQIIEAPDLPAPTFTPTTTNTPPPLPPTATPTPTLPPGAVCTVTTRFGINLRGGPAEGYGTVGSQPAGAQLEADGWYTFGGFLWWRLTTGEWVREDLVIESQYCRQFPPIPEQDLPPLPTASYTPSATSLGIATCELTALQAVRLRGGPGADFDQVGGSVADSVLAAYGKAQGTDGMTWWRLIDGAWVREDFVSEADACAALPVINPSDPVLQFSITPAATSAAPGTTCTATTDLGINLRGGPGANYDKVGSRPAGDTLELNAQFKSEDTFIWWRLTTGEWIREDLVTESPDCDNLPVLDTP